MARNFLQEQQEARAKEYAMLNRYAVKGQTVFAGSSLMEFFPINELQQGLDVRPIIYNRGIAGFVTADLAAHMEECIFGLEPARLFINIGTNDMGVPGYKKEKLLAGYDGILHRIRARLPACRVYVMAYYPVNAKVNSQGFIPREVFRTRTNAAIAEVNEALAALAARHGYEFADVNDGLADGEGNLKEEFTRDGIHLWPNAYRVILENLRQYL